MSREAVEPLGSRIVNLEGSVARAAKAVRTLAESINGTFDQVAKHEKQLRVIRSAPHPGSTSVADVIAGF